MLAPHAGPVPPYGTEILARSTGSNPHVQAPVHTWYTDNNNGGRGRYLMVMDKPLRPRSCAGPIRAGVRRRDISRHRWASSLLLSRQATLMVASYHVPLAMKAACKGYCGALLETG